MELKFRIGRPWFPERNAPMVRLPDLSGASSAEIESVAREAFDEIVPSPDESRRFSTLRMASRVARRGFAVWSSAFDTINPCDSIPESERFVEACRDASTSMRIISKAALFSAERPKSIRTLMSAILVEGSDPRDTRASILSESFGAMASPIGSWDSPGIEVLLGRSLQVIDASAAFFRMSGGKKLWVSGYVAETHADYIEACAGAAAMLATCALMFNDEGVFAASCCSMISSLEICVSRAEFLPKLIGKSPLPIKDI